MSRHRATDMSVTVIPLAQRMEELSRRSAAHSMADARLLDVHDHIAQISETVRQSMAVLSAQQQQLQDRYAALLTHVEHQAARTDEVIAASYSYRAVPEASVDLVADVRAMRAELQGNAGLLTGAQAVLDAGVRRMQTSGDALVRYLEDREVARDGERDQALRDVLEDFASSLHQRERRGLAGRLMAAVDRRRDARDAARWRRSRPVTSRPVTAQQPDAQPLNGQHLNGQHPNGHVFDAQSPQRTSSARSPRRPPAPAHLRSSRNGQATRVIDLDAASRERRAAPRQ